MKMKKVSNDFDEFYIPPPIKFMLDKAKHKVMNYDWDRVYLIDGGEGSGKSLLGLQLGYYLDPTLNLDRITFTGKHFSEAINKAEKNQCIIFDEAFNGLSSSGAASNMNRLIVTKLMECRQKNLFIIIILPTFFLLQKYAAIFRSKALFHVYVTRGGNRGYYRVYNETNKKLLFLSGQKFYSYSSPYIRKSYRFYGKYPINEQEYRKKKLESLQSDEKAKKLDAFRGKFGIVAEKLVHDFKMTQVQIIKLLKENDEDISSTYLSDILAQTPKKSAVPPPIYTNK